MQEVFYRGVEVFFLVFVRMTGLFVIAPIFGRKNIPHYFKIGFSLLVTIIMVNSINISNKINIDTFIGYAALVFKEFIVGLIIGFVAYLVFASIYLAGQLIDMEIGFGVVNVIDPMSNIQVPVTANFYIIITTLVFLIMNGHHMLIVAVYESYQYIPIGELSVTKGVVETVIKIYTSIFSLGFKIAAPITAAILVTDVALGIISKAMPQLNVFIVGMPLKIFSGLSIMIFTMSMYITIVKMIIENIAGNIEDVLSKLVN